jgi:hypothetical protein
VASRDGSTFSMCYVFGKGRTGEGHRSGDPLAKVAGMPTNLTQVSLPCEHVRSWRRTSV